MPTIHFKKLLSTKQKDKNRISSFIPNDTQLPINTSSEFENPGAAFNIFDDENEDHDEDFNVTGNLGSQMLSKSISRKNCSLLDKTVPGDLPKKPIKSIHTERNISLVPITLHNVDQYKKVFIVIHL